MDPRKTSGRVDGRRYLELQESHRTTLVVGMMDMLDNLAKYLGQKELATFSPMFQYAGTMESGHLREQFDAYMTKDAAGLSCAVASNFLSMLIEKSGVDVKLARGILN